LRVLTPAEPVVGELEWREMARIASAVMAAAAIALVALVAAAAAQNPPPPCNYTTYLVDTGDMVVYDQLDKILCVSNHVAVSKDLNTMG